MHGSDVGGDVPVAEDVRPGDGDRGRGAAELAVRAHVRARINDGFDDVARVIKEMVCDTKRKAI